jgi:hypothetical protein
VETKDHIVIASYQSELVGSNDEHVENHLFIGSPIWDLRDMVEKWVLGYPPERVYIMSFSLVWDINAFANCGKDHDDEDEDYDDCRWCGTSGVDRLDHISEMLGYDRDWLGGLGTDKHGAAIEASWYAADILAVESAYPGVDFKDFRFGPYPEWEASLYGGMYYKTG